MTREELIKWIVRTVVTLALMTWLWVFSEIYDHTKQIVEIKAQLGGIEQTADIISKAAVDIQEAVDELKAKDST